MGDKLVITIEVFGYILPNGHKWEHSGIPIVDEFCILWELLEQIEPLKNERWHKMTLQREHEKQEQGKPPNIYYTLLNMEIVPLVLFIK